MGSSYKYFKIKCNYAIFLNYFNGILVRKIASHGWCVAWNLLISRLLMTLNTISMISNKTGKFLLVSTV